MKRFLPYVIISLGFLALGMLVLALFPARAENTVGPSNLIICNKTAFVSPVAAGTLGIVSGNAAQPIHLCGWEVTSAQSAVTTFQFEYGTQGGPCTTPTLITPAFDITSTAPSVDRQQYATISLPAGAQLCVVSTGTTVGQAIMVWYAQFP